ncbi:hypothetical protein CCAN12_390020 [Capnocytophaga canimorsus]|uniref:Uncharacterized protein n=1 Tax=Capnocytophaga canimorsus TaxID=28188 RepID=A0A0B7H6Q3_9FLAO|nr:hypothetical protein CCAN12_390020 [Capnocytophaga canimorsus]
MDEPTSVINKQGNITLVNQVGCFGINLGRVDFYFTDNKVTENKHKTIQI